MAGRGNQTFLKHQKERKRAARAAAKREAQQARREKKAERAKDPDARDDDDIVSLEELMGDASPQDDASGDEEDRESSA